jgi:hypothetical protein
VKDRSITLFDSAVLRSKCGVLQLKQHLRHQALLGISSYVPLFGLFSGRISYRKIS